MWKGAGRFAGVSMRKEKEKMLVPAADPKAHYKMDILTGRGEAVRMVGQRETDKNKRQRIEKERENAKNGVIPTPERIKANGRKFKKTDRKKAVAYIFGGKELEQEKKEEEELEESEEEEG